MRQMPLLIRRAWFESTPPIGVETLRRPLSSLWHMAEFDVTVPRFLTDAHRTILEARGYVILGAAEIPQSRDPDTPWSAVGTRVYGVRVPATDEREARERIATALGLGAADAAVLRVVRAPAA